MKPTASSFPLPCTSFPRALGIALLLVASAQTASAANLFWDPNGIASDATYGGDGTWNTTDLFWNTQSNGTGSLQAWNNAASPRDSATFVQNTSGNVFVSAPMLLTSLTFGGPSTNASYALTGSALDLRQASFSNAVSNRGNNSIANDVTLFSGVTSATENNRQRIVNNAGQLTFGNIQNVAGFSGTGTQSLALESYGTGLAINGNITKSGSADPISILIGHASTSNTTTYTFGGNNTGLGGVATFSRGTLMLNNSGALAGASSLTVENATVGTADTAHVRIGTAGVTINKGITFNTLSTDTTDVRSIGGSNTSGIATYSGTITLGAFAASGVGSVLSVAAATGGTVVFSGQITDGSSTVPITKTGNGIVKFTRGAGMTYDGATLVSAGTLLVNNTTLSGTGTGTITVSNGATFGGTGSVSGQITLNAGGMLGPGDESATDFDGTSLIWNSNNTASGMLFELGVANTDSLDLTLAFTKGTGTDFIFSLENAGDMTPGLYTLVNFGSTDFSLSDFDYTSSITGFSGNFVLNSGNLQFNVVAVPEPSTCLLLTLSAGLLTLRRRRS